MTIDTQYLDADGDKIKLARPALLDMAQRVNNLSATSVTTIANLRAVDKTKFSRVLLLGYYAVGDGGGGVYRYDSSDTTTADNGFTVIVATDGGRWKLLKQSSYDARQAGALCDGATNDTPYINAAFTALGAPGGVITIGRDAKCLIDTAFTIPSNCHLAGPHNFTGTPGSNAGAPYGQVGGALLVNSAVTITTSPGASVRGLLIYRKGMTFPAANASAFAGTAITIGGDDSAVERCLIMGFNKAIYSAGYQRPRIENVWHDNVNGIEVTSCFDVPYISNCHAWPFASITTGVAAASLHRSGTAYYIHDTADWAKLTNCFSYGYLKGFEILNANAVTLLSCGSDNTFVGGVPQHTGSIGLRIAGASDGTRIIGFQSAAQHQAGIAVNITAGNAVHIHGGDSWGGSTHGVLLESGDLSVIGNTFEGVTNGITITSGTSRINRYGNRFKNVTTILNLTVANTTIFGGGDDCANLATGSAVIGGNSTAASVASATMSLPPTGDIFNVTGSSNFGALGGGWNGRTVTLVFAAALTVFHGTGFTYTIKLNGNVDFVAAANSTLTLRHNGTQWFEIGRCA